MTRLVVSATATAVALVLSACTAAPPAPTPVERGRYLVTAGGCNDCHTPFVMTAKGPAPDLDRLLSGHPAEMQLPPPPTLPQGGWMWVGAATNTAFAGPWGVSYSPNLTPDEETGIGAWDEQNFVLAMRTGQHLGAGRPILPPMPWQNLGALTDEDLKAIFAYLKSTKPIKNQAPEAVVAPPPGAPPA